jgi:tetratricopeptide (TPR) repeat protein
MAWLYNKSKRPQAKELAERAQRLQPRSAGVLDTLSEIHSDLGDFAKAVELQRKAVDLDGSVANYRLNLVKRLLAAGQKDQAKSEYEKLGRERPEYARSDEYRQLAKSL